MKISILKNLNKIFVFIRFDIENKNNIIIIDTIIKVINEDISNDEMCKKILAIEPHWSEDLLVEKNENQKIIYNKKIDGFFIYALEQIKKCINNSQYEKAYDIVDAIHILPEMIINHDKKDIKRYWKVYIKSFQKKWKCRLFDEWNRFWII